MNTKRFQSAAFSALTALTAFAALTFAAVPVMAAPLGDADPGYPVSAAHSTASRAAVKADLARTRTTGVQVQGESFVFAEAAGEVKTRAQVRAETLEAIRVGAISRSERSEFPTAQQLESIRLAGLRVLAPTMAGAPAVVTPALN